jgi:hypothetical protein
MGSHLGVIVKLRDDRSLTVTALNRCYCTATRLCDTSALDRSLWSRLVVGIHTKFNGEATT